MKPRIASEKEVESDEENGLNILELCAMILTVTYRGSRKLTDCPQKKKRLSCLGLRSKYWLWPHHSLQSFNSLVPR